MMLFDVCRVHPVGGRRVRPAGWAGAYWLIGPGSAGLAQGCRCALPLQAWAGAYRGGRPPPTFSYCRTGHYYNIVSHWTVTMRI